MRLRYFKEQMLLPIEEYIINQRVNIQGINVLLLSFTIEKDKNCLWMIYENEEFPMEEFDYEYREEFKTNGERMLYSIEKRSRHKYFHIKEMEIQGNVVNFSSSSSSSIHEMNWEGRMQLQHFIEKGLISKEWDDVKLENLVITQYEQVGDEVVQDIDRNKEISVVLKIDQNSKEVPIQHPFKVEFGKQGIGTKVVYYDETLDKEKYFFINEIYSFDVYEDIQKKAESIEDIKVRQDMINNLMEGLERICPRDKNLAVIRYEEIDNVQLCFYMKDYLEAEPICCNGASSIGFIGRPDEEIGINGYKLRECILQPVDKDFSGELEIELFSRYLEIPEETVKSL